jgi:hypothetical protein
VVIDKIDAAESSPVPSVGREENASPPPSRPATEYEKTKVPVPSFFSRYKMVHVALLFLTTTVIAGLAFGLFNLYKANAYTDFFRNYTLVSQAKGCHLYQNNGEAPVSEDLLAPYLNCSRYPYIYMTSFTDLPAVSLLTCRDDVHSNSGAPDCVSWFFRDGVAEK